MPRIYNDWRDNPYFAQLGPDVKRRAQSCRDKGMGKPYTWEYVADHLWSFYNDSRSDWPGDDEAAPSKELFYGWVKEAVQGYDAGFDTRYSA